MSEKYVVFGVREWDEFIKVVNEWSLHTVPPDWVLGHIPDAIPDAEVFRHQDLVAAPILYAASAIYQSYLELGARYLNAGQMRYMEGVVEHFFEAAERSKGLPTHKLPD